MDRASGMMMAVFVTAPIVFLLYMTLRFDRPTWMVATHGRRVFFAWVLIVACVIMIGSFFGLLTLHEN